MPEMKHTQTDWKLDIRTGCYAIYPASEDHNCLSGADETAIVYQNGRGERSNGDSGYRLLTDQQIADAKFICRAVNCHEELIDLMKKLVHYWDNETPVGPKSILAVQTRAILQKANEQ